MADEKGKAPAFQFYVNEWRGSRTVQRMTFAQRGMYIEMLVEQWDTGYLPDHPAAVADLLGGTAEEWLANWSVLRRKFVDRRSRAREGQLVVPPSDFDASRCIVNLRLERVRKERKLFIESRQTAGRAGGLSKAKKERDLQSSTAMAVPDFAIAKASTALAKPSSSSSSSSSSSTHVQERARVNGSERGPDLGRRAGEFIERYKALYTKHRKGAHYVGRPHFDFQESMELVKTWDDERLDKIATVFLTTDHEFAEKGSRTLAQFRSMASWCDGKLREANL